MKIFRTAFFTLIATLIVLPCLSSCSDDDDPQDIEKQLVGSWMLSSDFVEEDDGEIIMTLNADHTGSYDEAGEQPIPFKWSYDTSTRVLTLTPGGMTPMKYTVIAVDCCKLRLDDSVEDVYLIFDRVN